MTHRSPFQPLLFCDSVILCRRGRSGRGYTEHPGRACRPARFVPGSRTPSRPFGMTLRRTGPRKALRSGCPAGMEGIPPGDAGEGRRGCWKTPRHQGRCLHQPLRLRAHAGTFPSREERRQSRGCFPGEPGRRQPLASPCPPSAFIILTGDPERLTAPSSPHRLYFISSGASPRDPSDPSGSVPPGR